ncbi:MAG TPA: outer membrane beta-barrel protein, partial [Burkholderiales bacterium]|nr:outer membrane beta-barrel protein [Burkholderiales bacterium]
FTSCDDKDTAWKILGGYRFTRNLAVEVGYTDFGEQSASRPAGTVTFEATALEVVGVGSLPVADRFSVYGKIGMYRGDTDANDTAFGGGSASDSNTGLTFGIGGQYDFTKNLGIRGEWQRYADVGGDSVGESDVDVLSVGVIWKF